MRLEGIQAGRGVAALSVAAFHINVFLLPQRLYGGDAAWPGFNMGYAGVEFFFVISGFIMAHVHARDFGAPGAAGSFIRKRVLRIYPLYWIVLGTMSVLYFALPGRGPEHAREPLALLTSALLWPTPEPPILDVAWTLRHEMLFYAAFVLIVLSVRLGAAAFVAWQAACFAALFWAPAAFPWTFLLSPYNLLFLFGMAAAGLQGRVGPTVAMGALLIGLAGFVAIGLSEVLGGLDWPRGLRTVGYGVTGTLIVLGLSNRPMSPPSWLCFLGDASYAIYLVHLPVLVVGTAIALQLGAPWGLPPLATMGLLLVAVSVAGGLVHLYVERPLLSMMRPRARLSA